MMAAANIHYEIAEQVRGIAPGVIGAIHLIAHKLGLFRDIVEGLHLLKLHLPYHESDHVHRILPTTSWLAANGSNTSKSGVTMEVYLDALGAQRIP